MSLVEAQAGMTDLLPSNAGCGCDHETYSWTQDEKEVVVRVSLPAGTTSKQVAVTIGAKSLSVGIKSQAAPILHGELFKTILASDSLWCIEDKTILLVTLFKANIEYEEWWPHVCAGELQLDMKQLKPPSKNLRDLDDSAQATVHKMMFDQQQKRQGKLSSDELLMQQAQGKPF
jgi:hypothetical protein